MSSEADRLAGAVVQTSWNESTWPQVTSDLGLFSPRYPGYRFFVPLISTVLLSRIVYSYRLGVRDIARYIEN
jgi:hypothetical protein